MRRWARAIRYSGQILVSRVPQRQLDHADVAVVGSTEVRRHRHLAPALRGCRLRAMRPHHGSGHHHHNRRIRHPCQHQQRLNQATKGRPRQRERAALPSSSTPLHHLQRRCQRRTSHPMQQHTRRWTPPCSRSVPSSMQSAKLSCRRGDKRRQRPRRRHRHERSRPTVRCRHRPLSVSTPTLAC